MNFTDRLDSYLSQSDLEYYNAGENTDYFFHCERCDTYWSEDDFIEVLGDNEDTLITYQSFDNCPDCMAQLYPDFGLD